VIPPWLFILDYTGILFIRKSLIDEKDLTFRHAVGEQSPLSRANRSRMHQWLKTMELESRKAGHYLGIPE
jgi:hypothetical protein